MCERERKRKRKRASKLSFDDIRTSVSRNSSRQELKFISSTRATRTYQKGGISPNIQMRRFQEIKDFGLGRLPTRATALQEVEILPTWFIPTLRGLKICLWLI